MSLLLKKNGKSTSPLLSLFVCRISLSDFTGSADLGTAIQAYTQNMTTIVEGIHKNLIDNVYGPIFLDIARGGAMLPGPTNTSATYASTIIRKMSDLFYMKAIKYNEHAL